jgi:hypothetical protein
MPSKIGEWRRLHKIQGVSHANGHVKLVSNYVLQWRMADGGGRPPRETVGRRPPHKILAKEPGPHKVPAREVRTGPGGGSTALARGGSAQQSGRFGGDDRRTRVLSGNQGRRRPWLSRLTAALFP